MPRRKIAAQFRNFAPLGGPVKKNAIYLLAYPRFVWKFTGDVELSKYLDVFPDSDWAGDRRSRKSTSGGVASTDGAAIKHWSSTQGSVALFVCG